MSRLSIVLGSATRGNVVEALALAVRPMTSYRIARSYNMNIAKVYSETKKLASLGLIKGSTGERGTVYELVDEDLRRLALRLANRVVPFETWKGTEARKGRTRAGYSVVPRFSMGGRVTLLPVKPTRMEGELENLALLAKKRFDAKYSKVSSREYDYL